MVVTGALPTLRLMEAYDLGSWQSVQLLPGGKSQHYHVVTSSGEYVIRRSYRSKTLDGIRFEHELAGHLRRHRFPAPAVVPSISGDTCLALEERLYSVSVFVKGSPYRAGNTPQLQEVAQTLATYHQLVASFRPASPTPNGPFLNESLRKRMDAMPSPDRMASLFAAYGAESPQGQLLVSLPYALERGEAALSVLDRLYAHLPQLVIHAGCRRGSALFAADSLIAMLDFDSARLEARVLDLAVALHDFAKVYGDPASPDYKVPLDPQAASQFLSSYQEIQPLESAEVEALPALLVAKRLKRALGRYERLCEGEELTEGDVRKIGLELARVRWLETHGRELQAALSTAARSRP